MAALSAAGPVLAQQDCANRGDDGVCTITTTGNGQSLSTDGATHIINTASGTSITQNGWGYLLVDNQAGATISGLTLSPQPDPITIPGGALSGTAIINAGTIEGDLVFANGGTYVNAGGTITGNLTAANANVPINDPLFGSGFKTETFINRTASGTGVAGVIDPGNGLDVYAQSFAASGSHSLPQTLPTHFELAGVEALGADTVVTVTNAVAGQANAGLSVLGDGAIVNKAIINDLSFVGTGLPDQVLATIGTRALVYGGEVGKSGMVIVRDPATGVGQQIGYGGALTSFTNEGEINGDLLLRTARFSNDGKIDLRSDQPGTIIFSAADKDFSFSNSGTITMDDTGMRQNALTDSGVALVTAIDSTVAKAVSITNIGGIEGGLSFTGAATSFLFDNSGTISMDGNPNGIDRAVEMEIGYYFEQALNPAMAEKVVADQVTIINSGTLDGGIDVEAVTRNFAFTNSHIITSDANDPGAAAVGIGIYDHDDADGNSDAMDAETVSFTNSGTIGGAVELELEASAVTIINTGDIVQGDIIAPTLFAQAYGAVDIEQETTFDSSLSFTNSATISTVDHGGSAVTIAVEAGDASSGLAGAESATAHVSFTNSGSLIASGGVYITPGGFAGLPPTHTLVAFPIALAIDADAEGLSSIDIVNEAGGVINARGAAYVGLPAGPQLVAGQGPDAGGIAIGARGDKVSILNDGMILGSPGGSLTPSGGGQIVPVIDTDIDFENIVGGAIDTFQGDDRIINGATGVIEGGIALRSGNDTLINRGRITGFVDTGAGDDNVENYGSLTGNVFLGEGNDSFTQSLLASFDGIADGGAGEDTLVFDITGATYTGTIDPGLRAKFINFDIEKLVGSGAIQSNDEQSVGENGELTLAEGTNIDVGAGNTALAGSETGSETVAVTPTATITGNIDMRGGDNVVANQGTVQGDILAGDGDNSFTNASGGTVNGDVAFGNGGNVVDNQGTITGTVQLGDGGNSFTNAGSVEGDILFGAGDDELVLVGDWAIGGGVKGGAGTDRVQAAFNGSESAPQELDLSDFEDVEQFSVNGGVGKVGGTATFDQIDVGTGRLIGAAGSTITANVEVGEGGTFGSAGTVNGDIMVGAGGTLSPGASPATMTLNGNIVMASGSALEFEFQAAENGPSDQIIIKDGSLTIEDGAVLDLTLLGAEPFLPGAAYDMIVIDSTDATDSISGEFTIGTWDHAAVQGVLQYTPTRLRLVGIFVAPTDVSPQAGRSIAYVNGLLTAGQASTALLGSVPMLMDSNGFASAAAFGLLHPEAYASATQLGVDHGLSLAKAARTGAMASGRSEAGLFTFAQGLGDWRTLKGNGRTGVSRASNHSHGMIGGIGYGAQTGSVGAFVGYIDSRQKIDHLRARTEADGVVAGISGHVEANGFDLNALIAYDWSNARTKRTVPGTVTVSSKYDLGSLVLDASAGYSLPVSAGWAVRPEVGITHISTRRDAARESGSAAFALAVDRETAKATFLDGALTLRGGQEAEATFHPWVQAGLRHQLDGSASTATAGFIGSATRFTVPGADRKETMATAGAGFTADLNQTLRLFAAYQGEFGGGNGHNVNVGVRLAF
ncbi:MAG: autotransporter domain-containing protein [Sphingobium sp.]